MKFQDLKHHRRILCNGGAQTACILGCKEAFAMANSIHDSANVFCGWFGLMVVWDSKATLMKGIDT